MTTIEKDFRAVLDILYLLSTGDPIPKTDEVEALYLRVQSYYSILLPLFRAMRFRQ